MACGLSVSLFAATPVLLLLASGYGKHFDSVKMELIRDHVAPLSMRSPAR